MFDDTDNNQEVVEETTEEVTEQPKPVVPDPEQVRLEQMRQAELRAQEERKLTQERNFRELRDNKIRAEMERDNALRQIEELKKVEKRKLAPGDLVEWQDVEREMADLKAQQAAYQKQITELTTETKIKSQYPDFNAVVNPESLQTLREKYPEIANTILSSPDLYAQAVTAYTFINNLNLAKKEQSAIDPYALDREKAQVNATKPRPMASISPQQGESPLSHANAFAEGFTEELKTKLWKDMKDSMNSY
jgi:hypothetical protein